MGMSGLRLRCGNRRRGCDDPPGDGHFRGETKSTSCTHDDYQPKILLNYLVERELSFACTQSLISLAIVGFRRASPFGAAFINVI